MQDRVRLHIFVFLGHQGIQFRRFENLKVQYRHNSIIKNVK